MMVRESFANAERDYKLGAARIARNRSKKRTSRFGGITILVADYDSETGCQVLMVLSGLSDLRVPPSRCMSSRLRGRRIGGRR
jgi:hypothetical protein